VREERGLSEVTDPGSMLARAKVIGIVHDVRFPTLLVPEFLPPQYKQTSYISGLTRMRRKLRPRSSVADDLLAKKLSTDAITRL